MSKKDKLLEKLLSNPKDFTFDDSKTLLEALGYTMSNAGKTSGSRVKFVKGTRIFLQHKPHPRNTLLEYQVKRIITELQEGNLL